MRGSATPIENLFAHPGVNVSASVTMRKARWQGGCRVRVLLAMGLYPCPEVVARHLRISVLCLCYRGRGRGEAIVGKEVQVRVQVQVRKLLSR